MARPQLTNFPALHQALRGNHQVNTEFNAYVSALTLPGGVDRAKEHEDALAAVRQHATECELRAKAAEMLNVKALRFIRLLGELIESQHQLTPYVQDVSEKKHYDVRFSPGQIRMAMRWYWDVLSDKMEEILARGSTPADSSEEP